MITLPLSGHIPQGVFAAEQARRVVAGIKLITGSLEVVFGTALLGVSVARLHRLVDALTRPERLEDPNDVVVLFIQHRVPLLASNKTLIAASLLTLGCIKIVGAIGLLRHRSWGFYLLLALLLVLLPIDLEHVARHPALLSGLLLALNIGVLGVFIAYRTALIAHERG